jgi:hypothetical protein
LNGQFVSSDTTIAVINPATAEPFAAVATVDRARLATALQDAHVAFLQWRRLTGKARGTFLHKIADQMESRRGEIAEIITIENGKPLAQSQGEVTMAVDHLRWFAEEARRAYGRIIPNQVDGKRHLVVKTPMGVVGAFVGSRDQRRGGPGMAIAVRRDERGDLFGRGRAVPPPDSPRGALDLASPPRAPPPGGHSHRIARVGLEPQPARQTAQ